jgi:hypothetical protein
MVREAQQRICDLQIQISEDQEGLEKIFKTKKKLKKFTLQTLYDSPVLKAFKLRCKTKRVQQADAIAKAVGSLEEYIAQQEDGMGEFNLAGYAEERLENCLKREEHEEHEKRFWEDFLGSKCSNCDRSYLDMRIIEGEIVCSCGCRYKPLCEACGIELDFDHAKGVFVCRKCHSIFRLPTLKRSDFTLLRQLF